ncbi:MAG: hypothetical protein M9947_05230 [Thermomicrobiales bacterium]|nr:hypothetical protein [Thermomicrobiales bacterium]
MGQIDGARESISHDSDGRRAAALPTLSTDGVPTVADVTVLGFAFDDFARGRNAVGIIALEALSIFGDTVVAFAVDIIR